MPIARVPISGVAKVSGDPNGIKEAIVGLGGSPAADDIISLRDAAKFRAFDPAFLNGASNLAGIVNLDQFRGYPVNDWDIALCFVGLANGSLAGGGVLWTGLWVRKVSDNTSVAEASIQLSGSSIVGTPYSAGGQLRAAFGWINSATSPYAQSRFFLDLAYFRATYGDVFVEIEYRKNGIPENMQTYIDPSVSYYRGSIVARANGTSGGVSYTNTVVGYDSDSGANFEFPISDNPGFARSISGTTFDFIFDDLD